MYPAQHDQGQNLISHEKRGKKLPLPMDCEVDSRSGSAPADGRLWSSVSCSQLRDSLMQVVGKGRVHPARQAAWAETSWWDCFLRVSARWITCQESGGQSAESSVLLLTVVLVLLFSFLQKEERGNRNLVVTRLILYGIPLWERRADELVTKTSYKCSHR